MSLVLLPGAVGEWRHALLAIAEEQKKSPRLGTGPLPLYSIGQSKSMARAKVKEQGNPFNT